MRIYLDQYATIAVSTRKIDLFLLKIAACINKNKMYYDLNILPTFIPRELQRLIYKYATPEKRKYMLELECETPVTSAFYYCKDSLSFIESLHSVVRKQMLRRQMSFCDNFNTFDSFVEYKQRRESLDIINTNKSLFVKEDGAIIDYYTLHYPNESCEYQGFLFSLLDYSHC